MIKQFSRIGLSIWLMCLLHHAALSQNAMHLSLDDVIRMAADKSLQTTLNRNTFLSSQWAYKSYKANFLPSLTLYTTPVTYNNSSNLRYNSATQTDEYVRTETLNSYAYLGAAQNVALTGGTLFVKTTLNRIANYGQSSYEQYSSIPFQIGYSQEISTYNAMKWQRRLEPLKYTIAQKQFLASEETNHLKAVAYYFNLAMAQESDQTATTNLENNRQLLEIAQKRFALGTLTQSEILSFELEYNNARLQKQNTQIQLRQAQEALLSYLMLPIGIELKLEIPKQLPLAQVDIQQVLDKALASNPDLLSLQQSILEARENVSKTRSQRYLQATISASYGLSKNDGSAQQAGDLSRVYQPDFDRYTNFAVGINIPILDWGRAKGNYEMARSQQEVAELTAQQTQQEFEQSIRTFATTFNLQRDKIAMAERSDSIAQQSYQLKLAAFQNGKSDILTLTTSQAAKDAARLQNLSAWAEYWEFFYKLRKFTLYDFVQNQEIELPVEE